MPRLELIVKPLGKPPSTIPLDRALVVGRSRRADLTIDDEEVGREQFRIDVEDGGMSDSGRWAIVYLSEMAKALVVSALETRRETMEGGAQ